MSTKAGRSLCREVYRLKKCKKLQGCKRALGVLRTFCRKRKNKRRATRRLPRRTR